MKFEKGSIRRSLYYSILDGLFAAMMMGVSESYLIPYGIALGASAHQIMYLASIPMLVGTVLQTYSAKLTQSIGSRLKLINIVVFLHAVSWLPVILIPYIFRSHPQWMPWMLLVAATLLTSCFAFSGPAWQSLMSDYIPVKKRGKYFGWRNRLQGILTVAIAIGAGLTLHYFGKENITGFTLIFVFAMTCRFYSWICLTKMKEPFRHSSHDEYFSFIDFLKQFRPGPAVTAQAHNFARFVSFAALMSLCVNISGPLLAFFILKDLGYSYASYMVIVTTAALSGFLFQEFWGKFGDLDGNMKTLHIAGWGIALVPILWMVSRHLGYLFVVQVIAGCFWGGFNLLMTNFVLEALPPPLRIRGTSYFNVVTSAAILAGSAVGGFLFERVPPVLGYSFLTLFLISCAGRIAVMMWMAPKVREVRPVSAAQKTS